MIELRRLQNDDAWADAKALFQEYADWLCEPVCLEGFNVELRALSTIYQRPTGALILAWRDGCIAGCVGVRPAGERADICKMVRLYVRPEQRGGGVGRLLAEAVIDGAAGMGYHVMQVDTLARLREAVALYRTLGFEAEDAGSAKSADVLRLSLRLGSRRNA